MTVNLLLGMSLLVTAAGISLLPVGTCKECDHCRAEKLRQLRHEHETAAYRLGSDFCRTCGRFHAPGEPHE